MRFESPHSSEFKDYKYNTYGFFVIKPRTTDALTELMNLSINQSQLVNHLHFS